MAEKLGVFLSGFFLLACFSYLFRPNKIFTYTEHLYVGFAAAQAIVVGYDSVKQSALKPLGNGDYLSLVPLLLGVMLYARYNKSWAFIVRIPMALMMGVAAGVTITGVVDAQFIKQIEATMLPLNSINNVIMVVGTVSTLSFFLFIPIGRKLKTRTDNPGEVGRVISNLGRGTIMIALGSTYGFTVMARLSYLIGRLQFLLGSWVSILPQ